MTDNTQPTASEGTFDVRESLIGCIARDEQDWRFGDFEETSNHSPSLAEYIADGILANPLFEVRPREKVAPLANDVREAVATAIWNAPADLMRSVLDDCRLIADAILAAVEVRPRGQVTDAEVEAAREAAKRVHLDIFGNDGPTDDKWDRFMRAALEAARKARNAAH